MKTGKTWGTTECVRQTPLFEAHELHIKPNHKCSLHVHRHKWNDFLVIKGRLFIDVVKQDYPLTDVTELGPGEWTAVKPGEHHCFRTGDQECVAIEFYYPETLSDDIERRDHGGPCEEDIHPVRKGARR